MSNAQVVNPPQTEARLVSAESSAGSTATSTPQAQGNRWEVTLDPELSKRDNSQRFGDQISRAIIQTGACWTTDVIDPPLSKFLQDRFGKGTDNKTVWFAEILGDSVGGAIYVGVKQASHFLGKLPLLNKIGDPLDALILKIKDRSDESMTASGHKALSHWAKENNIDQNDPRYLRKLENYKFHQAESQVDSFIVAASAGVTNVIAQKKLFGNQNQWKMIGISKLAGSAATLLLMTGMNKFMPNFMQTLEGEMSDKYFSPVADGVKRLIGIKDDPNKVEVVPSYETENYKSRKHRVPVLETGIAATVTSMAVSKMHDREAELVELLPKSLGVGAAAAGAVLGLRALVPNAFRKFNEELYNRYLVKLPFIGGEAHGHGSDVEVPKTEQQPAQQQVPALAHDKRDRFMAALQRNYAVQGGDMKTFVAEQKRVCQAFVQSFQPQGRFAKTVAAEYEKALQASGAPMPVSVEAAAEDMLLHRRDAMLARLKLLDDAAFVGELEASLASGKQLVPAAGVSPEKKQKLIASLVQGSTTTEVVQEKAAQKVQEQKALLSMLEPSGAVSRALSESLSSQLGSHAAPIASNYLSERQEAARNVIFTLAPEGEIVKEAVLRANPARPKSQGSSWQETMANKAAAAKSAEMSTAV